VRGQLFFWGCSTYLLTVETTSGIVVYTTYFSIIIIMADHLDADDRGDNIIFVYTGGRVPEHLREIITHARVDESVAEIDRGAFYGCSHLLDVDFHDGVERVGEWAFAKCPSLRQARMPGVRIIEDSVFFECQQLIDVEFGDKLEVIGRSAFSQCISLRQLNIPSVKDIGKVAFYCCEQLTDAEFGTALERIGLRAFKFCSSLRRIAIPLKADMFTFDDDEERHTRFDFCEELTKVDIVWGVEIHNIVSHLSLQSWRNEMNQQINRINHFLPLHLLTKRRG